MESRLPLSIIADDLTGAADTGVQFAKRGFDTVLLPFGLKDSLFHDAEVVALNTATRSMQAELAYDEVKNAASLMMRTLRPRIFYKKIDSTLRGNIGAEIEAVVDATGTKLAILAPAFPAYGRTTEAGVHFVRGQPVADTEAAADPVSPVDESHIPTLVGSQTRLKVGNIALTEVRYGSAILRKIIMQHVKVGEKIIVFDAVSDEDLSNIADAGMSMLHPPLMVGSAGLADQLSRSNLAPVGADLCVRPAPRTSGEGVVIIISGSLSAVTSGQLDQVRKIGKGKIVPVDVCDLIERQETRIISEVISPAKASRVIGVQSMRVTESEQMENMPLLIVEWLGKLATQIVENCPEPIQGLILTGGDTALAVFKQLGISEVRLIDEILPGIPHGKIMNGEFTGLDIVTKAGAFGDENALVKCIDFLMGV